ncbi:MAG: hypothetical protein U0411_11295 [Thermodesulfovibrionales bacterium]
MRRIAIILIVLLYTGLSFSTDTHLLYNPGPNYKCFTLMENADGNGNTFPGYFDDEAGCNYDGNPANLGYCFAFYGGGANWGSSSCPSWYVVTYGWGAANKGTNPGWDVQYSRPTGQASWEVTARSLAKNLTSGDLVNCNLREVSMINHFYVFNSLKPNAATSNGHYLMGSFNNVFLKFEAALNSYSANPACNGISKHAIVNGTLGIRFPNGAGVNGIPDSYGSANGTTYLFEVVLFSGDWWDYDSGSSNDGNGIYLKNWNVDAGGNYTCTWDPNQPLSISDPDAKCYVKAWVNKLPYPATAPVLTTTWRSYTFEMKSLFASNSTDGSRYLPPPPPGYSWNDADIQSAEIYVSVYGADLGAAARNFVVIGTTP